MKSLDDKMTNGSRDEGPAISISPPLSVYRPSQPPLFPKKTGPSPKGSKGLKRRLSESARDLSGEGFSRLTRFGSGLKRKLSNSAKDLLSGHIPIERTFSKDEIKILDPSGASLLGVIKLEDVDLEEEKGNPKTPDENKQNGRTFPPEEGGKSLHKQISTSMRDLFTPFKTPQEKPKGQKKPLSRRLSFLTEVMLGKLDKGNCANRPSRTKRVRAVEVKIIHPDGARSGVSFPKNKNWSNFFSYPC